MKRGILTRVSDLPRTAVDDVIDPVVPNQADMVSLVATMLAATPGKAVVVAETSRPKAYVWPYTTVTAAEAFTLCAADALYLLSAFPDAPNATNTSAVWDVKQDGVTIFGAPVGHALAFDLADTLRPQAKKMTAQAVVTAMVEFVISQGLQAMVLVDQNADSIKVFAHQSTGDKDFGEVTADFTAGYTIDEPADTKADTSWFAK